MELKGAYVVLLPPALDAASVGGLREAIEQAAADSESRVIVLRGRTDETFCRGLDLSALASNASAERALEDFAWCVEALRSGSKPAVSIVRGESVGGGVGLAAACDCVVATPDASFNLTELLFGLTPSIVFAALSDRLTPQRLRAIALTSERIDAQRAHAIGLVDAVGGIDDAHATLRSWIGRLRRVDPGVVSTWKHMTVRPADREAVRRTLDRLREPDVRERLARFVESGEPPWVARSS